MGPQKPNLIIKAPILPTGGPATLCEPAFLQPVPQQSDFVSELAAFFFWGFGFPLRS